MFAFDSGPLCAFALVERLALLEDRYSGSAVWTVEVQAEIENGAAKLPELEDLLHADWLGAPIQITEVPNLLLIERLRWALGGSDVDTSEHRGEASIIAVCMINGYVAVLDDLDARRLAKARDLEIVGTLGILKALVADSILDEGEAWNLFVEMRRLGVRLPKSVEQRYFSDP